jgi:hypothetical protein
MAVKAADVAWRSTPWGNNNRDLSPATGISPQTAITDKGGGRWHIELILERATGFTQEQSDRSGVPLSSRVFVDVDLRHESSSNTWYAEKIVINPIPGADTEYTQEMKIPL